VLSEERSDEFHVFPETRRRAETIQSRYTATEGKSPEISSPGSKTHMNLPDTNTFIRNQRGGFTLIELMVVVGIIALLAGFAIPNLLTARTKARVSRALADMRTIATGLESYNADKQTYPPSTDENGIDTTDLIPTYITSIPLDPFTGSHFRYYTTGEIKITAYLLVSDGPDGTPDVTSYQAIGGPAGGPQGPWPVVIPGGDGVGEGEWYKPTVDDDKGDLGRGGP